MYSINFLDRYDSFIVALAVFILMMVSFFIGIRLRKFYEKRNHPRDDQSIGPLEGSLLGLLALLLSFTFSMSSSRHDKRLNVIIEEANNIGTAILRADLYPDSIRAAFRKDFKAYVNVRIAFFEAGANIEKVKSTLKQSNAIQKKLWDRAAYYGRDKEYFHRSSQMIPALNAMIDIVTTRNAASIAKVPEFILYLLFMLCFISSLMMGYTVGKKPDWIVMFGFAITIVMTIYLILDLDRPRRGIITMKNVNMEIVNLRDVFEIDE